MSTRGTAYEPISPHFAVKDIENAGKGVIASKDILSGTQLLSTDFLALSVLSTEYRREVCAQCFAYNQGRNLKIRLVEINHSFCSPGCSGIWAASNSGLPIECWKAVELFLRSRASKGNNSQSNEDPANNDGDGEKDYILPSLLSPRPTPEATDLAWSSIASTAHFILQARHGSKLKPHRIALQTALRNEIHADTLYWLTTIVLSHHSYTLEPSTESWTGLMALSADTTPYQSSKHLWTHIYAYLHLLSILPTRILNSVTPSVCREAVARDVHNSFGIRSLDDAGSEYFGWGVWPTASYFNHSCGPNVGKKRVGRGWEFWAATDVKKGEELCISYMGGDERDLVVADRGERLKGTWGFDCSCGRCLGER